MNNFERVNNFLSIYKNPHLEETYSLFKGVNNFLSIYKNPYFKETYSPIYFFDVCVIRKASEKLSIF